MDAAPSEACKNGDGGRPSRGRGSERLSFSTVLTLQHKAALGEEWFVLIATVFEMQQCQGAPDETCLVLFAHGGDVSAFWLSFMVDVAILQIT